MENQEAQIGDIVLVRWVDSSRTTDWTFQGPTLARVAHDSVGYLSHEDSEAVNVRPHRAIDADGDEQHVGDMTIPRRAILSIEVLHSFFVPIGTVKSTDYDSALALHNKRQSEIFAHLGSLGREPRTQPLQQDSHLSEQGAHAGSEQVHQGMGAKKSTQELLSETLGPCHPQAEKFDEVAQDQRVVLKALDLALQFVLRNS